jgi:hypothetical protein
MSKRPRVFVHGTARNLADVAIGYTSNGESMYTRNVAHSANVRLPGAVPKRRGKHTTEALIAEHTSALAKLKGDLLISDSPTKRARLEKSISIKTNFVQRLRSEQQ